MLCKHEIEDHFDTNLLDKHMENIVLYIIQKHTHTAEYEQIYFIHVRWHVTYEFWKQRIRERTLMQ